MKVLLLITTIISTIMGVYYIIILSKEYCLKQEYLRLAAFVACIVFVDIYLIVNCWQLIFK